MSDYIMHSSGEWKNHKWIRREGSPGNYKYYYKTTSSGGSLPGSKVGEHFKAAEAERQNKGDSIRDEMGNRRFSNPDTSKVNPTKERAMAASRNAVIGRKNDALHTTPSVGRSNASETKRKEMAAKYRNDQVNRLIDSMSGKTVTSAVGTKLRSYNGRKKYLSDLHNRYRYNKEGKMRSEQYANGKVNTDFVDPYAFKTSDPNTRHGYITRNYDGKKKYIANRIKNNYYYKYRR